MPSSKDKQEKLAMMSDVFRRGYERKNVKSPEERNRFLDKMVAWFDRLFDAWQEQTVADLKERLRSLGVNEEEVDDAIAQSETGRDGKKPERTDP